MHAAIDSPFAGAPGKRGPKRHRSVAARALRHLGIAFGLAGVAAAVTFRPDRAAQVAAGMAAHSLCSAVFVQGLDATATDRGLVQPILGFAGRLISYRVDLAGHAVTASFAGLAGARAEYAADYGCRLEYPGDEPLPKPLPPAQRAVDDSFAPTDPVAEMPPEIAQAIDRVFGEQPGQPIKDVKAVVVAKEGKVIAERYAPGFGIDTPLLSYSVAKSFTNAFLAVLVRQGQLRLDQPVGAPEWRTGGDPRSSITIEDLLRMRSGLDAEESGSATDPVARMEYAQADMAGFAARRALKEPPGRTWEYTSANTLILDRLIGQTVGGGATGMRAFAQREIFDPLHMSNVTMEFDGMGVFIGSTYVYATARDYARLGELYANHGLASDGRRILPSGWVAWSRRSTLGAPYGAGFWTNDGPSRVAVRRVANGFPRDGFFASGVLGQRIYIVPSRHLVIARFGYSRPPDFGIDDDVRLIEARNPH